MTDEEHGELQTFIAQFKAGDKILVNEGVCKGQTGTINKIRDLTVWCDNWSGGDMHGFLDINKLGKISKIGHVPPPDLESVIAREIKELTG